MTIRGALAFLLLFLSLAVLIQIQSDHGWSAGLARLAFGLLCVIGVFVFSLRECALLLLALILSGLALRQDDGVMTLLTALDRAAFFAAFIVLLTVLKEAATRSSSVERLGRFLVLQPSGRRFFAVAFGGHILGFFLNFGAISLLAPLIQSSTRGAKPTTEAAKAALADLERRQLSAVLRGFSWILLWAPTTLTHAVLLTLFPEADSLRVMGIGIITAISMIILGRCLDRFEWRGLAVATDRKPPPYPAKASAVLAGVCGTLILSSFALVAMAGLTTAEALMLVAPTVTLAWAIALGPGRGGTDGWRVHLGKGIDVVTSAAPALGRSAVALGLSGLIGQLAADVLPIGPVHEGLAAIGPPEWIILAVIPLLIVLGGQIALSPIVVVVFLAEILQAMPTLPATPENLILALSVGWSLSMTASPNATATILIASACNIPATTLTWRWNGLYATLAYAAFLPVSFIVAH